MDFAHMPTIAEICIQWNVASGAGVKMTINENENENGKDVYNDDWELGWNILSVFGYEKPGFSFSLEPNQFGKEQKCDSLSLS